MTLRGWAYLVASATLALVLAALGYEVVRKSVIITRLAGEAKRQEAARVEAEGNLAAEEASARALRRELDKMNADFAKMAEALQAKPREVVRWKTDTVTVPMPVPAEAPTEPQDPSCPEPECPPVAIRLVGKEARLETQNGNSVAVGEVDIVRTLPLPEEVVATTPLTFDTFLADAPAPQRVRWSVGPALGITSGGFAVGVQAVAPPVRLWRIEARPTGLAAVNAEGQASAFVGLTFGWRRR